MKLPKNPSKKNTKKHKIRTFDDFMDNIDMKTLNNVSINGEVFLRVVKCKDCAYLEIEGAYATCGKAILGVVTPDDYCSHGVERERING